MNACSAQTVVNKSCNLAPKLPKQWRRTVFAAATDANLWRQGCLSVMWVVIKQAGGFPVKKNIQFRLLGSLLDLIAILLATNPLLYGPPRVMISIFLAKQTPRRSHACFFLVVFFRVIYGWSSLVLFCPETGG